MIKKLLALCTIALTVLVLVIVSCNPEPSPPTASNPTPAPVTSVLPAEHPRDFPENLKRLTEEDKQKALEIALSTPEAQEQLKQESKYKTDIGWIALNPNPEGEGYSGYRKFDYEIVEEGIPRGEVDITPPGSSERVVSEGVPDDAEIYPVVTIWFEEPVYWIISVAVDLKAKKVVFTESYPNHLGRPDRFPPTMLQINATPSQAEYKPGQPVQLDFTFHNDYSEPVILSNPPETLVLHHDMPGNTEDWIVRSYPGGTEQLIIDEGQTAAYQFVWDQKDDDDKQVAPGHYYLRVYERPVSQAGKKGMSLGQEFEVFIQYEQGAMIKTIEVNQSQTVSGLPLLQEDTEILTELTVTLKQVELSEERAQFYALATLPGYTYNSPHDYSAMHWIRCADAEYTFSNITKDAGCADKRADEEGIWLMWGYVNPRDQVPKDAKELTFRIFMSFDNRPSKELHGPWEFKVPLD